MYHASPQHPQSRETSLEVSGDRHLAGDDVLHEPLDPAVSRSASRDNIPTTQRLLSHQVLDNAPDVVPPETPAEPTIPQRRAYYLKNWWLEICACLLFTLALIAIIITLLPHQGKPLPQWPYNISVNSLISIYVVVLKATVLLVTAEGLGQLKWRWFRNHRPLSDIDKYDSASRGPLGSFLLLWNLGLRHPLASCGALITVLMLAIDPFAQQIIRYYGCSVHVNGQEGKIPRTNFLVGAGDISIVPQMQSAINGGIFAPGSVVTPSCPTGNCSFQKQYDTVGYCSGCIDITNQLTFNFTTYRDSYGYYEDSVMISTPLGTRLNSTLFSEEVSELGQRQIILATMSTTAAQDTNSGLAAEIIVNNPYNETRCQTGNSSWYCLGHGAASCTMDPCVRTFTGRISTGDFQETLLAESDTTIWGTNADSDSNFDAGGYFLATIDTNCITIEEHDSLVAAGYNINASERWLPYNITIDPTAQSDSSFPSSMLRDDCMYVVDKDTSDSIWAQYLRNFFNGSLNGVPDLDRTITIYDGPQNLQTIYDYGNVSFDSVNSTFHNVTDSLTTYIRQTGNQNHSNPALGIVLHDETCLEVRWGWLALPVVLVCATSIFFVAMVIDTRPKDERAPLWKSSSLALIFHGLDNPDHLHGFLAVEEIEDMDRAAKGITVRLGPGENGMKLLAVNDKGQGEKMGKSA